MTAHHSNTNDHAVLAQTALGIIEKCIGFQGAGFGHAKAKFAESTPDFGKLSWEAQLDFDFELQSVTLIY